MRSLSRQLTASLAISLATFFIVQAGMVIVEVQSLSEETVLSRLQHDTEELVAALDTSATDLSIDWSHVPAIYTRPFSGHYFQFRSGNHSLRSRSLWDEELPAVAGEASREIAGPDGQRLLLLGKQYLIRGKVVLLSVGEDITPLEKTSYSFLTHLLLASSLALLALLAMQVWFIRRGLAPLGKLQKEIRQLDAGEIDLLRQPVPAEIEPLVDETNRLLVALRQRLERSRNAIGNLAHALKTPLTVVTQLLEREPDPSDRQEMQNQIGLIRDRIQRELSHARTAGLSPGSFWREPSTDIDALVNTMQRIHAKTIQADIRLAPDCILRGDREDMIELIGNLLDNACKWAQSTVRILISDQPTLIVVEDDGPGMDGPTRERVVARGVRADESKAGHGLGLAIVSDLVATYGGSLELGASDDLGGLRAEVRLPQDMNP